MKARAELCHVPWARQGNLCGFKTEDYLKTIKVAVLFSSLDGENGKSIDTIQMLRLANCVRTIATVGRFATARERPSCC